MPEDTKGAARAVAAGIDTLVTLRPRLFVVFILLDMLTTEEVVLVAEVEAVEKVVEGWSEVVFSTLVCACDVLEDNTVAAEAGERLF